MTVNELFTRLEDENRRRPGTHVIEPGVTDAALARWTAQNPERRLPADLVALLRRANGFRIRVSRDTPIGHIEFLPLERIQFAPRHMYRGDTSFDDEFPASWVALTDDPDSSRYLVLDTATGEYLDVDPIDAHSPDVIGRDVPVMLDWVAQFLED